MKRILFKMFVVLMVLSMVVGPVSAKEFDPPSADNLGEKYHQAQPDKIIRNNEPSRYVILFEKDSLVASTTISDIDEVNNDKSQKYLQELAVERKDIVSVAESTLGRKLNVYHVYDVILNGVSVYLTPKEAAKLSTLDGVRDILPVTLEQPDTDAGPIWIGAPGIWDGSTEPAGLGTLGEGILVGILDTGINFDHPSFSDTPADSFTYAWAGDYLGVCAPTGDPNYSSACNDKLVGAYSYTDEAITPEDADGHGSHTASTVAGNYVTFDYMGVETTISGVAPHAQIISYDVCDATGCYSDDSAAAVQQAILDGVDVINYSISGGKNPYSDEVELAFLEAFDAGIFVAASAGNLRDEATTDGNVNHVSPWVMTVAASSHNRKFTNDIDVVQPTGSIYADMALIPSSSPVPFPALDDVELKWAGKDTASISANYDDNREGCSPFQVDFFDGDVALIQRGICTFALKLDNAKAAGAIGMLLYADHRPPMSMGGLEAATLPAGFLYLSSADAAAFESYVDTNAPVLIDMSAVGRYVNNDWGDIKADFSFRGPSANNFEVLKPEITAPGLEVLAAVADSAIDSDGAIQAELYQGTSMSSPHTAGAGGLIKAMYPDWTAAEIKSAIMLTAKTTDLYKEDMDTPADLFDFGSGRVDLNKAGLTGLVMDETYDNFVAADPSTGGDAKTLNIPSLQNNACVGECSWTRTFTSVAAVPATYTVTAPTWMTVTPSGFTIAAGATQEITFTADVSALTPDEWVFELVRFDTDDVHSVDTPISDVSIPVAILPATGNIPEFVQFESHRDAGGAKLSDLVSVEITDLTVDTYGFVKGEPIELELAPDPTNGDAFDDLSQVFYTIIPMDIGAARAVAEITESSAPDVDLFWGFDLNFDGKPQANETYEASATATAFEYLSDWGFPAPFYDVWVLVQNWQGSGAPTDDITLMLGVVPYAPVDPPTMTVNGPETNAPGVPFEMEVLWHDIDTEEGDRLYGLMDIYADSAYEVGLGLTEIDVIRKADDVVKTVDKEEAKTNDTLTYTIEINNFYTEPIEYSINDVLPDGVTYVPGSVTGGATYDSVSNSIVWNDEVDSSYRDYVVTTSFEDPGCTLGFIMADSDPNDAYLDLKTTSYGFSTNASIYGDGLWYGTFGSYAPFNYYGIDYIGMDFTDDGYTGFAMNDVDYLNTSIPVSTDPNNLMAMFWDDFVVEYDAATNKGVSIVGDSVSFAIIEYDDIYLYDYPDYSMDVEIGYFLQPDDTPGAYEIVYAYDNITPGFFDVASGTIGVENVDGTVGTLYSYNDTALTIADGSAICFDWAVLSAPPKVITFQATVDTEEELLITNSASHTADDFGMLAETATASTIVNLIEPVADDQNLTTDEEVALDITLTGTGLQPGPVTWTILTGPEHGTLTGTAPDLTYTPDPDFYGLDSFTFKVNDGLVDSNVATISIEVTNVNDAPGAVDDFYTTDMDVVLDVAAPGVLENDFDADPTDAIIADLKDAPMHGTIVLNQDGSFVYTPDEGFYGEDSFTYYMLGIPMPKSEYTDWATVTITVNPAVKIYFPLIFK